MRIEEAIMWTRTNGRPGRGPVATATPVRIRSLRAAALAGVLALAACGGSGAPTPSDTDTMPPPDTGTMPPPPPVHAVVLPAVHDLPSWLAANPTGTVNVPAGEHRDVGGVRFSCPPGGPDCAVTVTAEDGTVAATSTDGMATAMVVPPPVHAVVLPAVHDLPSWLATNPDGTVVVPAGEHRDVGGVRFSCPPGGPDCAVTVTDEDGTVAATSTDGMATAMVVPPPVHAVVLPAVHDLPSWLAANPTGTVNVPAGEHRDVGGVRFSCPPGGPDCAVTVTAEDGTVAATSTDGMATAMVVPPPVHAVVLPAVHDLPSWLATNPDGTVVVPAGEHRDVGGVRFSCPPGGPDCAVTVTDEDGTVAATSTDGMATAMVVPPPVHAVVLPAMHDLPSWLATNPDGTVNVPAGEHRDVGGVRFSCPPGGADCAVTVTAEDGTVAATSTDGMATAMVVPPPVHAVVLPAVHDLPSWLAANPTGTVNVPAGEHRDVGGVRFSCPPGGPDCAVTVTAEDGTVAATSTDGMATAMVVPPPVHAVVLPAVHDLPSWLATNPDGTVVVPAGEHRDVGGVRFSCPPGGPDCAVTVTAEDGTVAATSTDGMATAMVVPPPVHAVVLPAMHDLPSWLATNPTGTVNVPAGEHRDVGGVRFSCPPGGPDCAVTVTAEDGTVAATSTDGMATAMVVPPPVHAVVLPAMHDLPSWLATNPDGTVVVPAGEHRDVGGVRFSCPPGGPDCAVTVTAEDGTVAATSTDGMATAMVVPPPVHAVVLPAVHDLPSWLATNPDGTVVVPAGEHRDVGGVRFSCPAGGPDCAVTVTDEDGTVAATSTDGMATAMVVPPPVHAVVLPAVHDLPSWLAANPTGTVNVPAGEHRDVGGVRFSCPPGGPDCAVTVTAEDGTVAATSTDGMATAMVVPPPVHAVVLPAMHDLPSWLAANPTGTVTVPAGEHRDVGGVRFSCPAGGPDCAVTVTDEDGTVAATSTDGMATAMVVPPPVHAVVLPAVHDLPSWLAANPTGTVTVPAGEHRDVGGVRFSCPAGGPDCAVTVTAEDGTVAATSTDGMATAMVVPPPVHAVVLPAMHDLPSWLAANPDGTVVVPAGEHHDVGGVRFSCPAGGPDCAVTVTAEDGTVAVTSTDGMATAMVVPPSAALLVSRLHFNYTLVGGSLEIEDADEVMLSCADSGAPTGCGTDDLREFSGRDGTGTRDGFGTVTDMHLDSEIAGTFSGASTSVSDTVFTRYGFWGVYGYAATEIGTGRLSVTSEGVQYSGPYRSAHAWTGGVESGTNPAGAGSAVWRGIAEATRVRDFQHLPGSAELRIDNLSRPRIDADIELDDGGAGVALRWTGMAPAGGEFGKGTAGTDRIDGRFHGPGHEEAWGVFDTGAYVGAFGAKREE